MDRHSGQGTLDREFYRKCYRGLMTQRRPAYRFTASNKKNGSSLASTANQSIGVHESEYSDSSSEEFEGSEELGLGQAKEFVFQDSEESVSAFKMLTDPEWKPSNHRT